jgi:hypothetical protein
MKWTVASISQGGLAAFALYDLLTPILRFLCYSVIGYALFCTLCNTLLYFLTPCLEAATLPTTQHQFHRRDTYTVNISLLFVLLCKKDPPLSFLG